MSNSLKKIISELILGVLVTGIGLSSTAFNIWCENHGYTPDYRRFEGCGKNISKNLTELNMPGGCGTIYIVNGVWVDMAARLGGF